MFRQIALILLLGFGFTGCLFNRLADDAEIATDIVAEIGGNGGRLFYSENQIDVPQSEKHSILLEVDDVPVIKNGTSEPRQLPLTARISSMFGWIQRPSKRIMG